MSEEKKEASTQIEEVVTSFTKKFRDVVVEVLGDILKDVKLDTEEKVPAEKKPEPPKSAMGNVRSIR